MLETPEKKGLPGLVRVRAELCLTQSAVAKSLKPKKCSEVHIRHIETGWKDCTQAFQRRLAAALCCTPADLLSTPTPERLRDIKIAYKRRELAQLEGDKTESEVA